MTTNKTATSGHETVTLATLQAVFANMRFHLLTLLLSFVVSINALHFYLDANQKRCFIEEIPTDTVVEGMTAHMRPFFHFGN